MPAAPPGAPGRDQPHPATAGRDWPILLGLIASFAALWALLDPLGPFPVNDDWAYSFAVRSIVQHGRFALTGFSAPNLITQAYWGALFCLPFGDTHEALQLSSLVAAAGGVCATYGLLRALGATRLLAALAAATLGANPIYLVASATFLTDAPFAALVALALLLFVHGQNRERPLWTLAAYAVALVALFDRQFALALPVAFGLGAICRRGLRPATIAQLVLPTAGFLAAHLAFQHWILATGRAPGFAEDPAALAGVDPATTLRTLAYTAISAFPYPGLFLAPFLAALLPARLGQRSVQVAGGVGLALGLAWLLRGYRLPDIPNVLQPWGIGPLTTRDVYILKTNLPHTTLAAPVWIALALLGSVGTTLILLDLGRTLLALARRRRQARAGLWPEVTLLGFCGCYVAIVLVAVLLGGPYDRYAVQLVAPLCAYLALGRTPPTVRPAIPAFALLAACALLASVAGHDYFAFQRTRWAMLMRLEASGVPAGQIDGGFEYDGARLMTPGYVITPGQSWWWVEDDRYRISFGPMPGYEERAAAPIPHWLPLSGYTLHLLERRPDAS